MTEVQNSKLKRLIQQHSFRHWKIRILKLFSILILIFVFFLAEILNPKP